jgi:hypothetical protein
MIPGYLSVTDQFSLGVTHEEPSLGHTQKHSTDDQTLISRNGCCTNGDNSPRDHNSADPFTRCEILHSGRQQCLILYRKHLRDVTGEFENDIWLFVSLGLYR